MGNLYKNRRDAGEKLAEALSAYQGRDDLTILALPRGGVPVGYEVAMKLHAPLDVFVVRKLGVPNREEFAMGAIASHEVQVLNDDVVSMLRIPPQVINEVAGRERKELERREQAYRGDRPPHEIEGRVVILVDDGLATGATMRAAVTAVKAQNPIKTVMAVPTAAPETCESFREMVDDLICLNTPHPYYAVGAWYEDFSQTSDEEVRELLEDAEVQLSGQTL
ncbi:MAG: phosphoribosyltransferase [Desulfovibrionales bacterium]